MGRGGGQVGLRGCVGTSYGPAEGHRVMDTGGRPGLSKGGKMTVEPKSSLREVVRTVTKGLP